MRMQNPQRHGFRSVLRQDQVTPEFGDDLIEQRGTVDRLFPGGRFDQEKPLFLLTFLPPLVYLRIERRLADSEFFRQLVAPTVVVDAICLVPASRGVDRA